MTLAVRGDTVREDLLVPLGFFGPGFRLEGFYRGCVGPGLLTARLAVGARAVFDRFGHFGISIDYGVDVSWILTAYTGEGWRFALGPAFAWDTSINYLASWDDAHAYWLGTQWLGPSGRFLVRAFDGWRVEAGVTLALIGLESRPPLVRFKKQDALNQFSYYVVETHSSERFVGIQDLQVLRLEVTLRPVALEASDAAGGWAFGVDTRLKRTGTPKMTVDLSVAIFASYAWGWP